MDIISAMQNFELVGMGQIALAAILGGIIGWEREASGRDAGLRTNILVTVAACLFTILSIDGFPLVGSAQDTARIAAQIVSGVGFLGAGAMFHTRHRVRGMTTAATIWTVAAIGMAVGAQAWLLAVFTTLFTAFVLNILQPVSRQIKKGGKETK